MRTNDALAPVPGPLALHRIACAVIAAEVGRLRGTGAPALPPEPWPEDAALDDAGLGIDSLERLGAVAALAETFDLDAAALDGPPQHLGDLIGWVRRGCGGAAGRITVMTSGSTGKPRPCTHLVADLLDEARHLASLLGDRRRIVAMVPAHHLYGMIWTALLPDLLGIPTAVQPVGGRLDLRSGDLVVAVPEQWQAILRLHRQFPGDLVGVTSGGPIAPDLGDALLAAGMARMLDIYGSSETGGIALRELPQADYRLLPRWRLVADGDDWTLMDARGCRAALPDRVACIGDRLLRPLGRRDGAVQIAGRNVWPSHVAAVLRATAGVSDVAVRLGTNGRLKAFVVPDQGADPVELARALGAAAGLLPDAERPKAFAFGAALPRNGMGKLTDWA